MDPTNRSLLRIVGHWLLLFTVAFCMLVNQDCLAAPVILDSGGFESYTVGALQGQLAGVKPWLTIGSGGGTAAVANSVGAGGSKGVQVDRASQSDDWWAVSYSGDGLPTNRYVLVDWDMKVNDTGAGGNIQGPFIGVETYDDTPIIPQLLGSLGVDATTRDVLYGAPGTGFLTETGVTVDNDWHHFQIRLDYLNDLYSTSVDNVAVTPQPIAFVDGASGAFTDADIAAFAAGADNASQRQTATAFIDNFLVRQVAPGDYNFDGVVDAADYAAWRHNVEAQQASLAADGDGDGIVNENDYAVWRNNYATAAPALSTANSTVPEPSTAVLTVCSISVIFWRFASCRSKRRITGH